MLRLRSWCTAMIGCGMPGLTDGERGLELTTVEGGAACGESAGLGAAAADAEGERATEEDLPPLTRFGLFLSLPITTQRC